jgi:hypothetical protein
MYGLTFETTQLISNHGYHKEYLHRFKITDDDKCPCDSTSTQSVQHLIRDCPRFNSGRHEYEQTCIMLNIDQSNFEKVFSKQTTAEAFHKFYKYIVKSLKKFNGT